MPQNQNPQRYIILPPRGLHSTGALTSKAITTFLKSFPSPDVAGKSFGSLSFKVAQAPSLKLEVIDTIGEDGAKLVEMDPAMIEALRVHQPGLKVVPERFFRTAAVPRPQVLSKAKIAATGTPGPKIEVQVVSKVDGTPIAGAEVVAFTDFAARVGAQATSGLNGVARLDLGKSEVDIERLYVFPEVGFWSLLLKDIVLSSGVLPLVPIDLAKKDCLRHFYGNSPTTAGKGIRVGVVDTGVDLTHPDLVVAGGENCVPGEPTEDFGPNGEGHGTHVAGIIAARGTPAKGIRGLAPAVELFSFRVFGQGSEEASNFAISKAIDRAVELKCDLVNLSLGGGDPDPVIEASISDARAAGVVVLAAAGNDDRSPVSFPASSSAPLGVSAIGRKGTFPKDSADADTLTPPFGKPDGANFLASFSNIGPELDLTAPGVAILSTVPGGYAAMMGTSMACPAATGRAAKLLAKKPQILAMPRTAARADAIVKMLLKSAKSLGFGALMEGEGML